MINREELSIQKAEPKATVNNSQAVVLSPNQAASSIYLAGFHRFQRMLCASNSHHLKKIFFIYLAVPSLRCSTWGLCCLTQTLSCGIRI